MAKPHNLIGTVQIRISTNEMVRAYLERLIPSGFHGKNIAEAAERLLSGAIERLVEEGVLEKIGAPHDSPAATPLPAEPNRRAPQKDASSGILRITK